MPDAEERRGNRGGGIEVEERERCRHAGVLHADFDADGASFRCRESKQPGECVAECEAESVVQDDGEGDERPDFGEARCAHGDDDADQEGDEQSGDERQNRQRVRDTTAEEMVECRA